MPPSTTPVMAPSPRRSDRSSAGATPWIDPHSLPDCGDASGVRGNVPDRVKQLALNTFDAYGVGAADAFAHSVGKAVRLVELSAEHNPQKQGRLEVTSVAEVVVAKNMLNGAGMMHGGCMAYIIDNCIGVPLTALGILQNINGVGVTQSMQITYHSPAPPGMCLRFVSTTVTLGQRVMSASCEVVDKDTGRMVASAFSTKMQPTSVRL